MSVVRCNMGAMSSDFLPAGDRNEMARLFAGLLTAKVAHDDDATTAQLNSILDEQWTASQGDVSTFGRRMVKQVEAGAAVAHALLRSLAARVGLTEAELQQLIAETLTFNDLAGD